MKNILRFAWIQKENATGDLGDTGSPSVGSVAGKGAKSLKDLEAF